MQNTTVSGKQARREGLSGGCG